MKKVLSILILSIISFFSTYLIPVNAASAPQTLQTGGKSSFISYINGINLTIKSTSDNRPILYCENESLLFPENKTINLKGEANKGYIYILQNKPNYADYSKTYYITQLAVWWYQDILANNNNNLSAATKNNISANSDEVSKKVTSLVQNAKNYSNPTGNLTFDLSTIDFTEKSGYFISEDIKVNSIYLTSISDITLTDAPSGASIINNTISKSNLNGTFQIKIPVSSISEGKTVTFGVKATGYYNDFKVYDYYYGSGYQTILYDMIYPTEKAVNASRTFKITREKEEKEEEEDNSLTIYKYDEKNNYIYNAELTLYEGDCLNKECSSSKKYSTWTTSKGYKVFNDIEVGYYTLVETKTPEGYQTADKQLINIKSANKDYTAIIYNFKVSDKKYFKISKTDIAGQNEIPGATLVLKDSSNKVIASWVSTSTPKYLELEDGLYNLTETLAPAGYKLNSSTIKFKIENQKIYEQNENGTYTKVDFIKMINILEEENNMFLVNINKLDRNSNEYVSGAVLTIQNLKGEKIVTWTTTKDIYYLNLEPGEYNLSEISAPNGYYLNKETIMFKVTDTGQLMIKDSSGQYNEANGIIMYNNPVEEIVEVPKTSLNNTLTYLIGAGVLSSGIWLLRRNGKQI